MTHHTRTLVKEREMTVSNTEMRDNVERLFNVMSPSEYSLTLEKFQDIAHYEWHSDVNRRSAGENLGCALIGAERGWPAQTEERFTRFLGDYDTDRIEKKISNVSVLYPYVKLFGVSADDVAPTIKGDDHIWQGRRLDEMQVLTREDQLAPAKVMKRVYDIEYSGSGFKDGYELFWPDMSYEASKIAIFNEQVESIKEDGRKMVSLAKSGARIFKDAVSSVANSTVAVAGSVAGSVAQVTGSAIDRMSEMRFETREVQLSDPVLAGIIFGSVLKDRRVFFIEIGRWV